MKQFIRNNGKKMLKGILYLTFLQTGIPACTQQETGADKTLSPYFVVLGNDEQTDRLPLKSTSAEVNIAGVIADVKIRQTYKNEGKNVLEAIYVFPASARAAVYDMKMTIGEREIIAVVMEKQAARQTYEEAKQQGKTASLLEQMRPNVFQMNVANILPGDVIEVELSYTEILVPVNSVYEFVFPTVVGPRYSNQSAEENPADQWIANPYTEEGIKAAYSFNIKANISAGMPIKDIRSTSHEVDIKYLNPSQAAISLKPSEASSGNRDFILQYRLAGNEIESGILLFEDKDEKYFLAIVQPPKQVKPESVPPREYIFIVDVSGSMHGFPLDISKKLLRDLITGLRSVDKFNVLLFSGGNSVLFENSMPATSENISTAIRLIDEQQGGGGTELLPALKRALAMKGTESYSRTFVIATDGYVSVEKESFDLIRDNLGNANFFAFGIGTSVNRYIIEGMAHVGQSEPFIITDPNDASKAANRFKQYISNPVLTKIKTSCEGFEVYDLQPENVPDVLAERPVVIIGKYKGPAKGQLNITGITGSGNYRKTLNISEYQPLAANSALKYLWAREKIRLLADYTRVDANEELRKTITELGLRYNLLTDYTSFVAVDSEVRNNGGNITTVKQPLPLPEGVSNYAVSGYAAMPISRSSKINSKAAESSQVFYLAETTEEVEIMNDAENKYITVEEMPEYPGGMEAFRKFIADNLRFSEEITKQGIKGRVYVQFVVDTDGTLTDIKIIRGINSAVDNEIIRVIRLSKRWKPGRQNGKPVKVQMVLPVEVK